MATSILDYLFRELAVSYLGRIDLAHVEPRDIEPDTVGRGESDDVGGRDSEDETLPVVKRLASRGYVRSRFKVYRGARADAEDERQGQAAAVMSQGVFAGGATGTTDWDSTSYGNTAPALVSGDWDGAARIARMKGYEGNSCGDCGNFTLVRNGTCLKCVTCGSTTGCS